ncbi:MAG: histidine kinase [Flavobacteriaceae bacterium]|nr:histidine kinase [Flavobacteriaceae bacterium]
MSTIKSIQSFFNILLVRHVLFWIGVFTYFIVTLNITYFSGYEQAFDFTIIYLLSQVIVAYVCIYFLIPKFLLPKKLVLFVFSLLLLLMVVYFIFGCLHEFYYHPKYIDFFSLDSERSKRGGTWNTLMNFPTFIGKSTKFLTPTVLIVLAKYYNNQQKYLQLNEQKKTTELATLKQQLNPHFLFNTLNNLYSLSVTKSDEAPEVIEKLSEMLDHMLYGCNDKFVSLNKEIELIENYLALEKVRYSDRVAITFTKEVLKDVQVAPLIFLTFIENAFKHGVSQELEKATIQIEINVKENYIYFTISNSIATNKVLSNKEGIGLKNVKKQLQLLYDNAHFLDIKEENEHFYISLKLRSK